MRFLLVLAAVTGPACFAPAFASRSVDLSTSVSFSMVQAASKATDAAGQDKAIVYGKPRPTGIKSAFPVCPGAGCD